MDTRYLKVGDKVQITTENADYFCRQQLSWSSNEEYKIISINGSLITVLRTIITYRLIVPVIGNYDGSPIFGEQYNVVENYKTEIIEVHSSRIISNQNNGFYTMRTGLFKWKNIILK